MKIKNLGNKELKSMNEMHERMDKLVKDILTKRGEILEEFAEAYIAETGLKPSQIILHEQRSFDGERISWWFEKK